MSSLNKVFVMGNLGKDPELKSGASGIDIVNFNIATKESGGKDKPQITEWHKIVAFGNTAKNCAHYLKKGSSALIEGRLQTRKWESKDGVTHYSTEIIANNVQFIGSALDKKATPLPPTPTDTVDEPSWEDIPF